MKTILIAIAVIVVCVGGLGYYLGWFNVGADRGNGEGHITLTVDENKFKEDEKKAKEKLNDLSNKAKDAVATPTKKD